MPDEPTAPPAASGSDQTPPAAAVPAGYVPQADLDRERDRARGFQAEADRLKAAAAASASAPPAGQEFDAAAELQSIKQALSGIDPEKIAGGVMAAIARKQSIADEATKLKTEFPSARAEVYDAEYATPEELRAAVSGSHAAEDTRIAALKQQWEADQVARMRKLGIDVPPVTPPAPSDGPAPALTPLQVATMPMSDFLKLDKDKVADLIKGA